ncbi:helix-turn-helix domain-containing protein [Polynucleobacter sp. JS-Safj-400b-B2]|uniref:helix-turn-helix domain-containing protein n=1 Tax=Polynucleobacter sp. JS-Safj-400b-B2 TaxID=2576921 RepID=UPI00351D3D9C
MQLGKNIKIQRRRVGITQEQLAELLKIETLTVSRYETGAILPPVTTLDSIARLLKISISDLFNELPVYKLNSLERLGVLLSNLSESDQIWIEEVVKKLIEHCQVEISPPPRAKIPRKKKSRSENF